MYKYLTKSALKGKSDFWLINLICLGKPEKNIYKLAKHCTLVISPYDSEGIYEELSYISF